MSGLLPYLQDKQHAEAEAQHLRHVTPISYWCNLWDDCAYSPTDFYALVRKYMESRHVPDLLYEDISLHEGTVFSPRRLYLQMRRERLMAEICASPFGSGFFISSRLYDRTRHAFYWDYFFATCALCALTVPALRNGIIVAIVVLGIYVTTLWSLMRLAQSRSFAWLDDKLCIIPWFGPIYETWFHPMTNYRQDLTNMYREAFNRSVKEAVGEFSSQQGLRPLSEDESRPILPELR